MGRGRVFQEWILDICEVKISYGDLSLPYDALSLGYGERVQDVNGDSTVHVASGICMTKS